PPAREVERKDLPAGGRAAGQARRDRRGAAAARFPAAGNRGEGAGARGRPAKEEGLNMRKRWGAVVSVLAAAALTACQEKGRPDPSIQMAVSHEREAGAGGSGAGTGGA